MTESAKPEQPPRSSVSEFFREAWSQALLKVSTAEEEANKVLAKAGDLAGWRPEEVKKLAAEFTERLQSQRAQFEKSMDEGIARAVSRLKVPRRSDIDSLWTRLDKISERIDALRSKRGKA
jgi:polyhydroxyalkanoate synthesis regulator phasin